MEQSLTVWIEDMMKKRLPSVGNVVKQKALKIFDHLKETGQPSTGEDSHQFVASKGWFEDLKTQAERASADADAADKYSEEFAKIVKEHDYLPDQIFNADETGLWWKKMPSRTFMSKPEKKTAPGFKVPKERIILWLCSNAFSDFMSTPLFINRSTVYERMQQKQSSRKIFLKKVLLDNAPSHATDLCHPNIQVEFLPRNTTSLLQPLDQGIIAIFKAYYMRKSFELILEKMESSNITIKEVWKQFSILNGVEIVRTACWKALLPEATVQETVANPVEDEYRTVARLANVIRGGGFDEIAVDDIRELVTDDEINEAVLVAMTNEIFLKPVIAEEDQSDSGSSSEFELGRI
uniref:HTH CENPB-type domain-containing protein n=1 Tax=Glossina austeni TaxID=7395 RepID=A0A1A9UEC8_GLOAU